MTIMGIQSIAQFACDKQSDFQKQAGLVNGENNLYVGASDKSTSITNSSSTSKFFMESDVDTENYLVSVGDDVEVVNGAGSAQIVTAGSNNNITSQGESKVYFQGGNANIKLGDGDDTVILSGQNINFDGGNGNNDITSGSLDIKLDYGQFFMNGVPVVKDYDIAYAFNMLHNCDEPGLKYEIEEIEEEDAIDVEDEEPEEEA